MVEMSNRFPMRPDQLTYTGDILREFTGTLLDIHCGVERERDKAQLQFNDVEVIKSVAPHDFPVAQLDFVITYNNGGKVSDQSKWGKLVASVIKTGATALTDLKGHKLHMLATEQKFTGSDGNEVEFVTWTIAGVDGREVSQVVGSAPAFQLGQEEVSGDPDEQILTLISGKTQGEFAAAFLGTPLGNKLQHSVFDGSLYQRLIDDGRVSLDENERYQRV